MRHVSGPGFKMKSFLLIIQLIQQLVNPVIQWQKKVRTSCLKKAQGLTGFDIKNVVGLVQQKSLHRNPFPIRMVISLASRSLNFAIKYLMGRGVGSRCLSPTPQPLEKNLILQKKEKTERRSQSLLLFSRSLTTAKTAIFTTCVH